MASVSDGDGPTATMTTLSCSESPLAETWSPPALLVQPTAVETTRRSFADPVLLNDPRVLDSLLVMDDRHLPSVSYFKYTQPDLQPYMRRMVVTWMMEVYNVASLELSLCIQQLINAIGLLTITEVCSA